MTAGLSLDLRYIRWLIGHMDEAERIFSAVQVAIAEPDLKSKVLALHPVLDALAEIVDDFPQGFGAMTEATAPEVAAEVKAEAGARGINLDQLLEIAEKLLPIILLFIEPKPEQ